MEFTQFPPFLPPPPPFFRLLQFYANEQRRLQLKDLSFRSFRFNLDFAVFFVLGFLYFSFFIDRQMKSKYSKIFNEKL